MKITYLNPIEYNQVKLATLRLRKHNVKMTFFSRFWKKIEVTLLRKSTSYLSVFNTIFNSFLFYVLWELENLHVDGCIYVIIYTFAKLTFFVRYKWQHIQILKNRNFGLFRDILSKKLPISYKKLWQNPSIYLVLPFLPFFSPFFCLFWEKMKILII